ncbi:putative prolyl 4-hydroxylase 12 isoform X2 [Apium graveolens]|uniref:putative prolyl 4-hydroxylase 12 isoform X2 n=1 Tax=Apium graveolens TaxID=4045 RepID=UPI003D7B41D6
MATHLSICVLLLTLISSSSILLAETRKELRTKKETQDTVIQLTGPVQSNKFNPTRSVQLSLRPRVFLYKGFLSDEECDHLILLGHGKEENLVSYIDNMQKDEVISRIEERISAWTFLPRENSHPMNIMHFGAEDNKQTYDFFDNQSKLLPTEQIMATVIFYLSNVSQGGQILFPQSDDSLSVNSHVRNLIWSDCTKSSNAMRPTKGNAILFFNLHLSASPDRTSSHSRCPVVEGEMWCAAKFFNIKAVDPLNFNLQVDNSDCTDEDETCPKWAEIGECERNPVFMIGSPDYYGTCRKSCNAC